MRVQELDSKTVSSKQVSSKSVNGSPFELCQLQVDDSCRLTAVHVHHIIQHMRQMIGIVSTTISGQVIYLHYRPGEVSIHQIKNYLCAAVYWFGPKWRHAMQNAFSRRYGED